MHSPPELPSRAAGPDAPLHGIRVVDMSTVLMGPVATQILGDYGADIVKVDPPEGDVGRYAGTARHGGMGSLHLATGRNKRSIVLDIKHPEGREVLLSLCRGADVFIHNVRPEAMRRARLDADQLLAVNPRLVYVSLVGFGQDGPYAGRPAFDDIIQGASGIADLFARTNGGQPQFIPWNVADRITGVTAAHATLAALLMRARTGAGQAIEVPMYETVVQMVLGDHMAGMTYQPRAGEPGYQRLLAKGRRPYRTADGHLVATPYTDRQFDALFRAVGRPDEMASNPMLRNAQVRGQNWPAIYVLLGEIFLTRSTADWLQVCGEGEIPCTPVRALEDLPGDPHLQAVGLFQKTQHPSEGAILQMRPTSRFSAADVSIRRPAPRIGEHSIEVLREIGLSGEAIERLLADGVTRAG